MNIQHAERVVANLAEARGAKETPNVTHFGASCVWTGIRDTDREAWLELRRELLTASDMAAILGEDPRRDAFDVYVDKVTPRRDAAEPDITSPMFWGKKLEVPIAQAAAEYYGWEIQIGGFLLRSRKHPFLGCTLDAEIRRSGLEGWITYEGKTSRITKDWDEDTGQIPPHILIQKQVQLLVCGPDVGLVYGLLQGCRQSMTDVRAYADFHAILVERAEWFMDLVRRGEPPTPTARSKEALKRLHPNDNGEIVQLGIQGVEWTREIQELDEHIKQQKDRRAELANMLRLAIGDATYGELPETVGGKNGWKWGTTATGARSLLAVKHVGSGGKKALPAPANLAALPEGALIEKYRTTRRRTRR